uniref:Flavodoxin-like domain-containing protein n=2 Tax=Sar TaxID=2698737 RepID=A0A7S3V348_9STRA|mmetsp:Transcript_9693/g.12100  ORF Transcript_9693/g.12100 Transcript_9693/m.12100 type:complete len:200 (+) Transcript_9693:298-897(+)|eukprot:CAMPEP_0204829836 /NCGR_PEP_ID=MMETSP1346-20131115/8178_1 /ASSEMBLY_ACC=CAM_ASM_000771 /TAXON_ID=215587 /ORGANISM="Aplanochytrium stocchinoi, Strain GSBS06" /LENGTH=199 /DNA_ID=CAMNT_0051959925 /DNA_START=178 /DNA_END=777 /DNA_ORIENTATION=-
MAKKVFVIYYSMYGHILKMAESVKEGLEEAGVEAEIYQVDETLPEEVLGKMGAPPKADYPVIDPQMLTDADGFMFGIPTRFGMMAGQMKSFFDRTGQHWMQQSLAGKPAGIFVSTAQQGGGQETTALTTITQLTHHGMVFVPLGYQVPETMNNDGIRGGGPWGAGTLAGGDGSRQPTEVELSMAKKQGELFGKFVNRLA